MSEVKEKTLADIEEIVVLVQIDGNCHQVYMSKEDKESLKHLISNLTNGMKLSSELMPVKLEKKP